MLKLKSTTDPSFTMDVKAYVLKQITSYLPESRVSIGDWDEFKNISLADPHYDTPNKIDVLLGAEVYSQIIKDGVIKSFAGSPVAQCTSLGWILSGPINSVSPGKQRIVNVVMHTHVQEDDALKRFWEIEMADNCCKKILTLDEQKCEDIFVATTKRDSDGKYIVKLPFRTDDPPCKGGNSREIAIKRFYNLEKKLAKDNKLKNEYTKVINEYLSMNHMKLIKQPDYKANESVYLPHHAVVREDKSTTKTRVVFDASCKNENGISLNDTLLVGPTIQGELRHLIMRWRSYPVCLTADIIKMYRMIKIAEEDNDYQRIIWRENINDEIKDYKLLTVTFGTSSAPFLAVRALNQVAYDEGERYPLAAARVAKKFYMDDLMTGGETVQECLQIYHEMNELLMKAGFKLQKWNSNKDEIMEVIQNDKEREGREKEISNTDTKIENIEIKTDNTINILGLTWNRNRDEFQYSVKLPPLSAPVTKRKILSDVARLYDPMGWIAPSVVIAKVMIQKLWLAGLEWDEEAPKELIKEWLTYRSELPQLTAYKIPRWMYTKNDNVSVELHGFSDASQIAYAAVVYARIIDSSGVVHVSLVSSRSRVAPIKQISIPRLELCGAVLLAKLLVEVADILVVPITNVKAWTDSTVVLAWLSKHPSSWKTFVANRVSEILTVLDSSHWYHVSSKQNPADCASRGLSPSLLIAHDLWNSGPEFLWNKDIEYSKLKCNETHLEETVKVHHITIENFIVDKYSDLTKAY
ncbi:uncharacterized protein LOC131845171 [Achroia grisella]|uniref:uncharacterized protein LOC131845171 n=1 Tax=Achroia grisella TaxID=688607 RepID=UPI0027D34110|nr:uncharacterized protein LOC131845171 [Achroia grisella]